MSNNKYVEQEVIEKINKINLIKYAEDLGYTLVKKGHSYEIPHMGGLYIKDDGTMFNCFATKEAKGGIIQLAMYLESKSWLEAVNSLKDRYFIENTEHIKENATKNAIEKTNTDETTVSKEKELIMPQKADNYKRLFAYLNKSRGIDNEIIQKAINEGKIYQSKEKNNIVFKIFDENKNVLGASWQTTLTDEKYRGAKGLVEGTKLLYPFEFKGTDDTLYVFESPIDLMSFMTLKKQNNEYENIKNSNFIAIYGINSDKLIDKYLEVNQSIKEINLCLDNDIDGTTLINGQRVHKNHGQEKAIELKEKYMNEYAINIITPTLKDFNDDLKNKLGISNSSTKNEIDNIENKKANTHLQNSENISKQTSEEIKDNSKLSEFYKQEKKLQEEANKIINSIDEMQNTLDTLKKNYETTITKLLTVKNKIAEEKENYYKDIIENNAYTMLKQGIKLEIVQDVTKLDIDTLEKIKKKIEVQNYEINNVYTPNNDEIEEINYGYTLEEEKNFEDVLILEQS